MTQNYIYKKIDKALSNLGDIYYVYDDLHVYYWNCQLHITFSIFRDFAKRNVERYLKAHGITFTSHNATRGGYLGGGRYREFTSYTIDLV